MCLSRIKSDVLLYLDMITTGLLCDLSYNCVHSCTCNKGMMQLCTGEAESAVDVYRANNVSSNTASVAPPSRVRFQANC